ncbi:peptidoglycan editing factor PgeF [Nitrospira sp. M1]
MDSLSFPECIPAEHGFVHFFGTRQSPAALVNTVQVGQVTPVPPDYPLVISLKQVHGKSVLVFDEPLDGNATLAEGDALVTSQPQVLLVVRTADCVPVLFADLQLRVVAAVHAGWRGAVAGIVEETLSTLKDRYGTKTEHLRVAIGPSIGACCFEVDGPVISPIKAQYPYWAKVVSPISSTHAKVDLKELIFQQLQHQGIALAAISKSDACTQCDANRFYSYRREGRVNGTMLSGIMINP